MPVSQTEMALSRGHVPSYLCHQLHDLINLLFTQRGRQGQMMAQMSHLHLMRLIPPQILFFFQLRKRQHSSLLLLSMLFDTVYQHFTSYDMNGRPIILFCDPLMENPVEELPAATFFQLTSLWPRQFEEVISNLLLLHDTIVCAATQSTSSKQLAIFLLLR
jgi:hypothetical protein